MDLLSVAPWHYKWLLTEGCQTLFICINKCFDTCHPYASLASMPTMSSAVLRRVSDCSIIRPIIGCQSQPFLCVAPQHYQWLLPEGYQIMFMCIVDHFEACHLYDSSGSMWIMPFIVLSEGSDRLLPRAIHGPFLWEIFGHFIMTLTMTACAII